MAEISNDLPRLANTSLAGGASPAALAPWRRGAAAWTAEVAVLLLRALAIVVLLSPALVAAALLAG